MVGYGGIVDIDGGMVDGGYDEITYGGIILLLSASPVQIGHENVPDHQYALPT